MSKRTLLFTSICAWLVAAGTTSMFVACGSSSNNSTGGGGTDGGKDGNSEASGSSSGGSSSSSGGTGDSSDDSSGSSSSSGGGDGGCSITTGLPTGTQVVKSAVAVASGVTSDGNVIWYDTKAKQLMYVPVGGGTSAVIGAWDGSAQIVVGGKAVFYWNAATTASATAPSHGVMSVWTQAGGNHSIAQASYVGDVDISKDGNSILYFDKANLSTVEIWTAGIDGSNPTRLAPNVAYNSTSCVPNIKFLANTPSAAFCTTGVTSEAGAGFSATIEAFGTTPQIFTTEGFTGYNADPAGTNIVFIDPTGMYVQAVGATTPSLVDKIGGIGIFTNSGTSILYLQASSSTGGSLYIAPATGGGTPDAGAGALVATGSFLGFAESISSLPGNIRTIPALSTDDKWVYVYGVANSSLQSATDFYVTSTAPGSTPKHVVTNDLGLIQGDAFTADNSHATFYENASLQGNNAYVADFADEPLPPTGMPNDFSTLVWQNYSEATGTKVIYNDNYGTGSAVSTNGVADVKVRDVAGTTASTLVLTQADANLWMTVDRSKLVYSWNACPGAQTGVWVMNAP